MKTNEIAFPNGNGHTALLEAVHAEHLDLPHGIRLEESNTLHSVLTSERWVPSDRRSRIIYPAPAELVLPFIERLSPLADLGVSLHVQTSHPNSVQDAVTDEMHTAYGRVLVEARIGQLNEVDHYKSVGFVYALDQSKPEVQIYSGYLASACINLAIFRRDNYLKADLLSGGEDAVFRMTEQFVASLGEDERDFMRKVRRLQETVWTEPAINERIGRLYREVLTKGSFGSSTLNYAIKLLADPNSRYALQPDGTTTAWNFFSALTQYVTDKAYVNVRAEKTLQIAEEVAGDLLEMPISTN